MNDTQAIRIIKELQILNKNLNDIARNLLIIVFIIGLTALGFIQ